MTADANQKFGVSKNQDTNDHDVVGPHNCQKTTKNREVIVTMLGARLMKIVDTHHPNGVFPTFCSVLHRLTLTSLRRSSM